MHAAVALATLLLALDGESSKASNSTGMAIIVAVSMVFGYALIFALWWFVFRERAREPGRRDRSKRSR
jgi:Na+/proline symporter